MKTIILTVTLLVLSFVSQAQNQTITGPSPEKKLIANETWIVASGKSQFRIMTSDDSISYKIMRKFEDTHMVKFVYTQKSDRKGKYWQRDFYFKNESWNTVAEYIKKIK